MWKINFEFELINFLNYITMWHVTPLKQQNVWRLQDELPILPANPEPANLQLASCLIYARAFIEYVCGCVLFQYVTVREIRLR